MTLTGIVKVLRSNKWPLNPTLENADDSIMTAPRHVIADEVKQQLKNALACISELLGERVVRHFQAAALGAQIGIRTVVYDVLEPIILDLIWTAAIQRVDW